MRARRVGITAAVLLECVGSIIIIFMYMNACTGWMWSSEYVLQYSRWVFYYLNTLQNVPSAYRIRYVGINYLFMNA